MWSQRQKEFMSPVSRAVQYRLKQLLQRGPREPPFIEQLHEFDDCIYKLTHTGSQTRISFALPALEDIYVEKMIAMFKEGLAETFDVLATSVQPEPGYQITLDINTQLLQRLSEDDREYWIQRLASVRLYITGAPLRQHFLHLAEGTLQAGPVECQCSKAGQVYFVKPHADSVTVILPVRFVSNQDAAIGHALLQEFVEARRSAALGLSPSCTYHPAKAPPLELRDLPAELLNTTDRGYMCFTFFKRHVNGPQLDYVVWSMNTFYTLISYHIKACKAMIHGRMRVKLDAMIQALPPPVSQHLTPISRPIDCAPGSQGPSDHSMPSTPPLHGPNGAQGVQGTTQLRRIHSAKTPQDRYKAEDPAAPKELLKALNSMGLAA